MREPLDQFTADRLLSGDIRAEDAPSGYEGVVRLFESAGASPTRTELRREAETVAAGGSDKLADFCTGAVADHKTAHPNNGQSQIHRQRGQQNAEEKSGGKSGGNGHKP